MTLLFMFTPVFASSVSSEITPAAEVIDYSGSIATILSFPFFQFSERFIVCLIILMTRRSAGALLISKTLFNL